MEACDGLITHLVLIRPYPNPSLQVSGPGSQMTGHSETKAPGHPAPSSAVCPSPPPPPSGAGGGGGTLPSLSKRGQLFQSPVPTLPSCSPYQPPDEEGAE